MKSLTDTLLVSITLTIDEDDATLIVGRKRKGESVEIVNAFQGKEATDLYNRLINVQKGA